MNEVLFSIEIPKTFEVGFIIGIIIALIADFIGIYINNHT